MTVMVFDIETVPDVEAGRTFLKLKDILDLDVGDAMLAIRRSNSDHEFLPLHWHKIVAISVVVETSAWVKVWSLGDLKDTEPDLLQRFFEGIQKFQPTLVSWNGTGFDLPVIHYRSLKWEVSCPIYWDQGEKDPNFKWNNYLNRYHARHLDLMDILSLYQSRAAASLNEIAELLGYPGKIGMHGGEVWMRYQKNEHQAIRDYCEIDVLNTYLIYLKFQVIRGISDKSKLQAQQKRLREYLEGQNKDHFNLFLEQWAFHE